MDMSGLEVEEIEAIAEHERIPEMAAAELGNFLLSTSQGRRHIKRMISARLDFAYRSGNRRRANALGRVLSNYVGMHPDCKGP
jgi:hypothetical protein